jgi:hypothetical protein
MSDTLGTVFKVVCGIFLAVALVGVFILTTCGGQLIDTDDAVNAAEAMGFTKVQVIEEHRISPSTMGGCSDSDKAAFDLRALNARNQWVNVVACCGWPSKACTIRVK